MLTIILDWFFILFTAFCIGFAFSHFAEKILHYRLRRTTSILMAGIIMATVYAQIFSLFYRVNVEADIILVIVCIVICIVMGRRMLGFLGEAFRACPLPCRILIPLLFLVWSYFTSRGYMVPDMDMYHGQSIRWIEEYGAVKGIGLLHCRFGYNSSIFAVSALYSMKFLGGQSLHAVNGLIAFLLSCIALDLRKCFPRRKMLLSDYARAALVYYLTTIWDEIIAPSSDYAVMCTIFFIIISWLTLLEEEDGEIRNNIAPYALLCVAGVYALTLKLTAGLILVLVLKPAYLLLREKRWKEICIYLMLGLAVAVPWMTRTVIITGWLFYPFAALDLFQVDWKMTDVSIINTDAYLIKIWAKGANRLADGTRLGVWFPNWFRNILSSTEKLLISADILSCVLVFGTTVRVFAKRQWQKLDTLLVFVTVLCCYLFWQFSAPMLRYGYAHVLLLAALTVGYALEKLNIARVFYVLLIVYGAYKLYVGCDYIKAGLSASNYIWQQTYDTYEVVSYELDGFTFYYSPNSGPTGYDPFPTTPAQATNVERRGDELKDGFRMK